MDAKKMGKLDMTQADAVFGRIDEVRRLSPVAEAIAWRSITGGRQAACCFSDVGC
jgi:hypothetical protein